ncbi:MAG TPA: peptidoglycan editing factor PgeF [bacterium]|nr:peptidoglycan editing factor PgeF [bacterium]
MLLERVDSLLIGRFAGLDDEPVIHGFSTRHRGKSRVDSGALNLGDVPEESAAWVNENQTRFLRALEVGPESLAVPGQVHSGKVACIEEAGFFPETDGLITRISGVTLSVKTADCVPLFLWDPEVPAAGLIHAGWRGTVHNIAGRAVRSMAESFGCSSSHIQAYIGPSIGPCCFTVGDEVGRRFAPECREGDKVNLWIANARQLLEAGISPSHIHIAGLCTACHPYWFFSHRARQGRTGRMLALFQIV